MTEEYLVRALIKIITNRDFIVLKLGGHYNIKDSLDGLNINKESAFVRYTRKMYGDDEFFIMNGDILSQNKNNTKNTKNNLYSFVHGKYPDPDKNVIFEDFTNSNVKFLYSESHGISDLESFVKYIAPEIFSQLVKEQIKGHLMNPKNVAELAKNIKSKLDDPVVSSLFGFIFENNNTIPGEEECVSKLRSSY